MKLQTARELATLFDKDILIYGISQLMAAMNRGEPLARKVRLTAHDLLLATNRETSGDGYARLCEAFERLAGTRITTNVVAGGTLPDYSLSEAPGDILCVTRRAVPADLGAGPGTGPVLKPVTLDAARALLPGWDVHALQAEWRAVWDRSGRPALRAPDAAFLGWLRKRQAG